MALGQSGVSLLEMAGAYAVFASGGYRIEPHALLAVTTAKGKTVWRRAHSGTKRAFPSQSISDLNEMLRAVVEDGTGRRARHRLPAGSHVAGKTGTGDEFVDAWFLGYTSDIVIGVWVGNDRPRPGVYGGTAPAKAFNAILRDLLQYTDIASVHRELP